MLQQLCAPHPIAVRMPAIAVLTLTASLLCIACEEPKKPPPLKAAASVSAVPSAPPAEFVLPSAADTKLRDVPKLVSTALVRLPKEQRSKIDDWLSQAVKMPVELTRTAKESLSETSAVACKVRDDKLQCSVPAKIAPNAAFFVTSTVSCLDKEGKPLRKADWTIPADIKRGTSVAIDLDTTFVQGCWEEDGARLQIDLFGSKCKVPFSRVVKCAGEFTNCQSACKQEPSCLDKCESNRRICLSGCK